MIVALGDEAYRRLQSRNMQTIFNAEKVLAVHCLHDVCVVTQTIGVSASVALPLKGFEKHNYVVNVLQVKGGKEQ